MKVNLGTGDVMHENRFIYTFVHRSKIKTFGPHESLEAAQESFQKVYGYWPGEPLQVVPYALDPRKPR